jgi:tripartite ATP-independent transporter DctM subunit
VTDLDRPASPAVLDRGGLVRAAAFAETWLDRLVAGLAATLLVLLLGVVIGATGARYLFGTGFVASEDLGIWLHGALVFLGLPLCATGPLAMRLDLLTDRLAGRAKACAEIGAEIVVVAAALVLISGASTVASLIGGVSPTLDVPEAWRFWPVIGGGCLAVLRGVLRGLAIGRAPATIVLILVAAAALLAVSHQSPLVPVAWPSLVAAAVACLALLVGAPLAHSLILGLALAVPFGARLPEAAIVQQTVSGIGKFLLLAIPFFLLAGMLMNIGGLAGRLVRFASALVGHRRGGMAQATLLTNLMFSGVSGSSIADAAFGAKVLAPALVADGVARDKAAAIVAATAVLPNIVPPSVAFLLLASATNLSVGGLFTGGLVAGLILAAAMAAALHVDAGPARRPAADRRERRRAFFGALPVFGLALVVFLGIRLGIATPTEAASVAALYALVAALAAEDGRRATLAAFLRAGRETAAIGLLVASSAPLVFLLAVDGLPQALADLTTAFGGGPLMVMLVANLILLAVGGPLDVGPGILLFAPLLLPAVIAAGIDPIHFGVILTVNLMIGGLTPPVGVLVFVVAGIGGLSNAAVFRAVLPLTLVLIAALSAMALAAAVLPLL